MWNSPNAPSGIEVRTLGWSKKEFVDHEGLWLTHQMLTQEDDLSELEGLRLTKDGKGDEDDPSIE